MPVPPRRKPGGAAFSRDEVARLVRAFFRIMELWRADLEDARAILGNPPLPTFEAWRRGEVETLPDDTLRRIGHVARIYRALQILYADPSQADEWLRRLLASAGGKPPIQRIATGNPDELEAIGRYLDAARAPWS